MHNIAGPDERTVLCLGHSLVYGLLSLVLTVVFCGWHRMAWIICIASATVEESHLLYIAHRFASFEERSPPLISGCRPITGWVGASPSPLGPVSPQDLRVLRFFVASFGFHNPDLN